MPRSDSALSVGALALTLLIIMPAASREATPLDGDELTALRATAAAVQLGAQFRDSIWPGYNLDKVPFLVYVPDRWALLANAPRTAEQFTSCPEEWPPLGTTALYHAGQYDGLVGQLAFDVPVGSLKTAAVGCTGQGLRAFLEYVIHENFHQYQHAHFGDIAWEREELYPIEDTANTSLAGLEVAALRDALNFSRGGKPDSARLRLAWFVAARTLRWQADPFIRRYEQGQEINEGTAKYVEMRALDFVPRLRPIALGDLPSPLIVDSATFDMADALIGRLDYLMRDGAVAPMDMPRIRIYPVGAALGLLLDFLQVDWKPSAQQAGPDFAFADQLAQGLNLDTTQCADLLASARIAYDYDRGLRRATSLIAEYRSGFDSALAVFESQPGVRIEIEMSGRNLSRSRNSTSRQWVVDKGAIDLRGHYGVYVLRSRPGDNLVFEMKESGLLERNDWTKRQKTLLFFCPHVETMTADGSALDPAATTDVTFQRLEITGSNFELSTSLPGTIAVSDSLIRVNLLP